MMCKPGSVQLMYNGFPGKIVMVMVEISPDKIPNNHPLTCSLQNHFQLLVHVIDNIIKSMYKVCTSMFSFKYSENI